jgi:2-polyprenyl-6-methoxyphenol hydroxylase-like FAD-dependent oxidoreductase
MTSSFVPEPKFKAAVLGGSIAGLMTTLVLRKKGFEVVLYERQNEYKRSIQWTVRQDFIDYLYSVDKDIAEHLFVKEDLVSAITNGFRYLSDKTLRFPDGAYLYKRRDGLRKEAAPESLEHDECAIPNESCEASLAKDFIGIIRAKDLEAHLLEQIQIRYKTDVRVVKTDAPQCELRGNEYVLLEGATKTPSPYNLIVVCVGAGKARKEFKIKFNPVSRERAQVAGDVQLPRRGMVTQYQHAKVDENDPYLRYLPSGELLYSTLLSTDQDETTCWVIGDVSSEFVNTVNEVSDPDEKNRLAKIECGKIAARTLLETEKLVLDAGVNGVVNDTVKSFVSQAKISSAAYQGDNLVLAGDAVGAGHWAIGGGMHVAGMCHQKRLDALATALLANENRTVALEKYSSGVLDDTMAWISRSMQYYYLSIPKEVVNKVFEAVMTTVRKDDSIDAPSEIRERIISVYFGPKGPPEFQAAGFNDTL